MITNNIAKDFPVKIGYSRAIRLGTFSSSKMKIKTDYTFTRFRDDLYFFTMQKFTFNTTY